jgi:hypothetical protein
MANNKKYIECCYFIIFFFLKDHIKEKLAQNYVFLIPRIKIVAPQILIVLFLIYLFDNIIQLISLRSLWYYGGW